MQLFRWLVYSQIWIASGACSLYLFTHQIFGLSVNPLKLLFIFLSSILTYRGQQIFKNLNRQKHKPVLNKPGIILNAANLFAIGVLTFVIDFSSLELIILFLSFALCFFYVFPISKSQLKRKKNLRNLPYIKIFLIALVWALICALLPLVQTPFGANAIVWFLSVFCFIVGITIPFDIRDLKHDHASMKTLPQVLGIRNAKLLGIVALSIAFILFLVLTTLPDIPIWYSKLFALIILFNIYLILMAKKEQSWFYCSGLIDGTLILFLLSLLDL